MEILFGPSQSTKFYGFKNSNCHKMNSEDLIMKRKKVFFRNAIKTTQKIFQDEQPIFEHYKIFILGGGQNRRF